MKYLKYIFGVLVFLAIAGGYVYPKAIESFGTPVVGTTFSTAKVAAINMIPSTASATSSSIYNGDDNDRFVTDAFVACGGVGTSKTAYTGTGLANWTWYAATTTTNAPSDPLSSTATNLAMNVNVSTTTAADAYTATTTYTQVFNRRWAAGAYMTFQPNATNTATCNVGVHYLAL